MSESAARYLERRTATAFSRVTAIVRGLPERLAATNERQEIERVIVSHPWLVLGGTFAATTLLSRSLFTSETRVNSAVPCATDASSQQASESTREAATQGSILGAFFMPLAAYASRALLEGFLADGDSNGDAPPSGPDVSTPPAASDVV